VTTIVATEYVALNQRTFGVDHPVSLQEFRTGTGRENSTPLVGPVIISELMYHPPETPPITGDDEYIELHNVSAALVQFYDPAHPTNTWRLSGGVGFSFP